MCTPCWLAGHFWWARPMLHTPSRSRTRTRCWLFAPTPPHGRPSCVTWRRGWWPCLTNNWERARLPGSRCLVLTLLLGVYLLGWLGNELTLRIAVILGDVSPWLALLLFAFSFVCTLTASIVILTLAGRELGIRQLLPEDEREIDDRDTSMTRLLLITLLPFLAMYAAFGEVRKAADRLVVQQFVRYGALGDQQTALGALYDLATNHLLWMLTFIVGIYV